MTKGRPGLEKKLLSELCGLLVQSVSVCDLPARSAREPRPCDRTAAAPASLTSSTAAVNLRESLEARRLQDAGLQVGI